jgi:molecular chaperone DnaK (HSP70)
MARFSIGVDLGTSNSVLAYSPLWGEGRTQVLAVAQYETPSTTVEAQTLPSFLYLPEEAVAAQLQQHGLERGEWVVGRLAQRRSGETPGRVVKSAKSWLAHHAADRSAAFLPWGSDALGAADKISPVAASAKILAHLRNAWNQRFAKHGPDFEFDAQNVTVTVPASFDAAAQRLTLTAAAQAGYPENVRLLEEPQAAFYWWLERHGKDPWRALPDAHAAARHVLVVDVGGGTSDFSLFELTPHGDGREPTIKRVAVSDHILLGGDNIDLAIAHLFEPRLAGGGLSPGQWDHLVARCRALKEKALGAEGPPDEAFTVSIPARGSNLFAQTLSAEVKRAELEELILDGFFPHARANDRPRRALGAVKEFGLPYAFDGAVTRHLADFLRDRPTVDAVLFNGGSLHAERLRKRLVNEIGGWQDGRSPLALENPRPDLAVACGAAYSGRLVAEKAGLIEAGNARAVFLEVNRAAAGAGSSELVCILPHGAAPAQAFELEDLDLRLRLNRLVRFQLYTSTRDERTQVGDLAKTAPDALLALPPLETVAEAPGGGLSEIPVSVSARMNELGLLQVACRSLDPGAPRSWPLEFNLRPAERPAAAPAAPPPDAPNVPRAALAAAQARITAAFAQGAGKKDKFTAPRLLDALEKTLGRPKGDWNGILLRDLWTRLEAAEPGRALSAEHEEVWLILAGYLLRPGFGVTADGARVDALWRILQGGLRFQGKRSRLQEYILWRRVAGGLSAQRQEALLAREKDRIFQSANVAPELIRMAGAFERIGADAKAELIERFLVTAVALAAGKGHVAPYLAALGLLLNRTPFYAGPENVVAPSLVERAYDDLRKLDWSQPDAAEAQTLFLRAARVVDDRRLDLPPSLRHQIADKLVKSGVTPVKAGRVRRFVPLERAERMSLYGEALPAGLILSE